MKLRALDRITAWEAGTRAAGRKAVSFEEYCLRQPLGEPERLPESLVLQAAFELANWLVILSSGYGQAARPVAAGRVEFAGPLGPGEVMEVTVEAVELTADRLVFHALGTAGGRPILRCEGGEAELVPLASLEDPADRRTLFSEIATIEAGGSPT
ncbi:MAG: hypothetical protein GX442_20845 [Candidatus Riflebacteria bacterium]|nr:hypothetical protein [Candidatus Riflebacteria bacterium]